VRNVSWKVWIFLIGNGSPITAEGKLNQTERNGKSMPGGFKRKTVTYSKIILVAGIILVIVFGCSVQNDAQEEPQTGKKEVPVITLKNLSPPFKDYDYFQGIEKYGFQIDATSFSLINAWWLAEVSTLVYADEEFVKSRFKRAGLPEVKFFDRQSTQCYVANNDKFAIVAFRGSEIWKRRDKLDISEMVGDLKADVDIRLVDWPLGGKVHRGFKEALDEVWPDLLPYMRKLTEKGCKMYRASTPSVPPGSAMRISRKIYA
jgi:hypothetical protein